MLGTELEGALERMLQQRFDTPIPTVVRSRDELADRTALVRLVGAVLAEQNDEWIEQRRYLGLDVLAKARLHVIDGDLNEGVTPTAITA